MKILLHPTYFPSIIQMAAVAQAQQIIFEIQDNYQKQTYRNRAHIAHSNGLLKLHIPIKHSSTGKRQKTKEVKVENDFPWQEQHWKSLQSAYRTSPFFEFYEDDLEPLFSKNIEFLLEHNLTIFNVLMELIGNSKKISTTEKYVENPTCQDFRFLVSAKTEPHYKMEKYIQVHEKNHGFIQNLSILDLLFNQGPNSLNYLETQVF